MDQGEPPVIANGVVYAYGSGENTDQAYSDVGLADVASRRIPNSTHAVLYALDAQTGKELWSSGDDIKSWLHNGELSVANGTRVYRHVRWHACTATASRSNGSSMGFVGQASACAGLQPGFGLRTCPSYGC